MHNEPAESTFDDDYGDGLVTWVCLACGYVLLLCAVRNVHISWALGCCIALKSAACYYLRLCVCALV
jgi:hypothetical protein